MIRYCVIDVSVEKLMLGGDAEVVGAVEIRDGGRMVRLAVKASHDVMPDGALGPMEGTPLLVCEVTAYRREVRFRKP